VQGLTGVFCELNSFMMGQQGMNTGGVSALFNDTLVDYGGNMVGLKAKTTHKRQTLIQEIKSWFDKETNLRPEPTQGIARQRQGG
jgi:hypothetical protein